MAQAASNARSAAAAALKESVRDLNRLKASNNLSQRLLQNKYDKVAADKSELFNKHCVYAEKSNLDLEAAEQTEYIEPKMDEALILLDEVFLILDKFSADELMIQKTNETTLEDTRAKQDIKIADLQRSTDEKTLRESIEAMKLYTADPSHSSKEHAGAAHTHLTQIDESFGELIKSWNVMKRLPGMEEPQLTELFDSEETVRNLVCKERIELIAFINKLDPERSIAMKSSTESEAGDRKDSDSNPLKSERIKNPKFTGDIRAFANFKADFEKIVAAKYVDKTYQAYVMKQSCLVGECKKLVENMNDIDKIWERLEMRYGDSNEIIDIIVQGLESFKFTNRNNQDQDMIKLVDQLEKGLQDLAAINKEDGLANALTVLTIEKKIPRPVFNRWNDKELEDHKDSDDSDSTETSRSSLSKFQKLYKFLLKERKKWERAVLLRERVDRSNPPPPNPPVRPPGGGPPARQQPGQRHLGNANLGQPRNANNKCIIHPEAGHLTRKCHAFLAKSVEERGALVKDANGCKFCLSVNHQGQPCPFLDTWHKCGVGGCQEAHSRLLHGYTQIATFHITIQSGNSSPLLLMQGVAVRQGSITFCSITFWDNGSTLALISKHCARRNGLIGVPVLCDLLTVGGNLTTMRTILYEVELIDREGKSHTIRMYEIEDICGKIAACTGSLAQFFPSVTEEDVSRPVGSVDILIGMENADIHPHQIEWNQGLVLYQSKFGSGKIIGGMNKGITSSDQISDKVRRCAQSKISNVRILRAPPKPKIDFFTAEQFGVDPPPRCDRCKGCKMCRYETVELSQDSRLVLDKIRDKLELNPLTQQWTTEYPYQCDPSVLKDNRSQAVAMTTKTEKRLERNNVLKEKFHEQVQDLVQRGVFVRISEEEQRSYKGPVFYVTMHEVYKPDSLSTPIRLVINSSLKYDGASLNDVLMKGPDTLNNLFGIQLKFRTYMYALVCDMSKMYHTIHTTEKEKHLRRVLYRRNPTDEFTTYGITRAMFGDKPAAAITRKRSNRQLSFINILTKMHLKGYKTKLTSTTLQQVLRRKQRLRI